jgi:hypothetical protein
LLACAVFLPYNPTQVINNKKAIIKKRISFCQIKIGRIIKEHLTGG